MKPKCSWPYSQEPVTGPCTETRIQSTTPYPLFATNINVILPHTFRSHKCFSDQHFLILPLCAACSVSYPWFHHPVDSTDVYKWLSHFIHVRPSSFSFLISSVVLLGAIFSKYAHQSDRTTLTALIVTFLDITRSDKLFCSERYRALILLNHYQHWDVT
jgi:hypothetical protein